MCFFFKYSFYFFHFSYNFIIFFLKNLGFNLKEFKLQIYGDPEAADIVFTSGAEIVVVGINITTQVTFTGYGFLPHRISNWSKIWERKRERETGPRRRARESRREQGILSQALESERDPDLGIDFGKEFHTQHTQTLGFLVNFSNLLLVTIAYNTMFTNYCWSVLTGFLLTGWWK